ncbi:NADAR family protein [Massilia violaceinigra]|uniref:NADAR family protein n=1 Tax=Massilia violaceinigra TaxID=2045208 RepID=A0ABY4AAN5_9BURK|nr:NADAR family protein [Massilia violaceinigra]UOD31855.1 NADAR family protein [Massilia violaceinigra]
MALPNTLDELRSRFNAGESFSFLHFWGHTPPRDGVITRSCFSQWYQAPFELDGDRYPTAEHFMMAEKARLFKDEANRAQVLAAPTPGAAKALGRKVANFVEADWLAHRFEIVCRANVAKFGQNPALRDFLTGTGKHVLVEASPLDRIWGTGLAADDPRSNDPNLWEGPNLLGFALMQARSQLQLA